MRACSRCGGDYCVFHGAVLFISQIGAERA